MVATGLSQVNGNLTRSGSGSSVCLYSKNGDIQINTSVTKIDGSLYAPNGTIQINGNVTINGRIIAKKVQVNGSVVNIVSSSGDLTCLPGTSISLVE
jgi:cytoskeletal protein CcmA (bactofilin family)